MSTQNLSGVSVSCDLSGLAIGLVLARGCQDPGTTDDLVAAAVAKAPALAADEAAKKAARDMLRFGKYKPTGRGKPASEYLLQAALENQFPRVNALVDLCNIVSLETQVPISLIDLERAGVTAFNVRRGKTGESYVFNAGGQSIELEDLLLTARGDEPCANAVKDSLATKLGPDARDVLAVIYAPGSRLAASREATERLAELYRARCHGEVASAVLA